MSEIRLEFFYDCSSPWTYLGFTGIHAIAERHQIDIEWRPILGGGVFNAVNQAVYAGREAMFSNERRMSHYRKDLKDWADYYGLSIGWPDFHPVNAVKSMRGCFIAEQSGQLVNYSKALFEAYWGREEDISNDEVLKAIIVRLGIDETSFFEGIQDQAIKDRLRANTNELIERGGYGSPTLFINGDDMYFGNDRLPLVEAKLASLSGR